jgi:hypothetical protein
MDKTYPQIIVTGDSIAQLSFAKDGYGAALVEAVSSHALQDLRVRAT